MVLLEKSERTQVKEAIIYFLYVGLFFPSILIAQEQFGNTRNCWEVLLEDFLPQNRVYPDSECVRKKASESFAMLCSEDGQKFSSLFMRYLEYKIKYEDSYTKGQNWLRENPGDSLLPLRLSTEIKNTMNSWIIAGKKGDVEHFLEKVARKSYPCAKK